MYAEAIKKKSRLRTYSPIVPKAGLEPAHLATHASETCVSTNSTTSAKQLLSAQNRTCLPAGQVRTCTPKYVLSKQLDHTIIHLLCPEQDSNLHTG